MQEKCVSLQKRLLDGFKVLSWTKGSCEVRCPEGHEFSAHPEVIARTQNYDPCMACRPAKKAKKYQALLEVEIDEKGWALLRGGYGQGEIIVACKTRGHIRSIDYKQRSHYLHPCYECKLIGHRETYGEKVRQNLAKLGFELISNYVNDREAVAAKCQNGHVFKIWASLSRSVSIQCTECTLEKHDSMEEAEIHDWLEKEIGNSGVVPKIKIGKYQYDIMLPTHKLLIEHHGLYWHTTENLKQRMPDPEMYHHKKYLNALEHGYRCIQIFGDDWKYRETAVKSLIMGACGSNEGVHARDCEIKPLGLGTVEKFLEKYALTRKNAVITTTLGVFHNAKMIGVLAKGENGQELVAKNGYSLEGFEWVIDKNHKNRLDVGNHPRKR